MLGEADEASLAKLALDGFKASEPGAEFIEKAKAKEELRDNPEMAEELMISLLKSPEFLTKIEEEGPDSAANYLVSQIGKEKEEEGEAGGEEESTFESLNRKEKIRIIENKAAKLAEKNRVERAIKSTGEKTKRKEFQTVSSIKVPCVVSLGSLQIMTEDQLRLVVKKIIKNNA
jgi:hypothetical protein